MSNCLSDIITSFHVNPLSGNPGQVKLDSEK